MKKSFIVITSFIVIFFVSSCEHKEMIIPAERMQRILIINTFTQNENITFINDSMLFSNTPEITFKGSFYTGDTIHIKVIESFLYWSSIFIGITITDTLKKEILTVKQSGDSILNYNYIVK